MPSKIIVLSRLSSDILCQLIDLLQTSGGHTVQLVITAPGYNHSLEDESYTALGTRVAGIIRDLPGSPPPVLTVTSASQMVPFIHALDPDILFSLVFPYALTKPILAHRSKKMNGHGSPLPLYRGPNGLGWAIVRKLKEWAITWHYIDDESYDTGRIIIQKFYDIPVPCSLDTMIKKYLEAVMPSMLEAVKLVENGYVGEKQRELEENQKGDGREFTRDERMIKPQVMSGEDVWLLVEACRMFRPALLEYEDRLYEIKIARKLENVQRELDIGQMMRKVDRLIIRTSDGAYLELLLRVI